MSTTPAERIPVGDVAGQQRFLNAIAACVESTSLPLHARPVLQNLEDGKFEKLSFLTGTCVDFWTSPPRSAGGFERGRSSCCLSMFGSRSLSDATMTSSGMTLWAGIVMISAMLVLGAIALIQLLELPFRSTASHSIFRLAVVNAKGEPGRYITAVGSLGDRLASTVSSNVIRGSVDSSGRRYRCFISALVLLLLWIGAAVYAVVHPHRGLHDRLAGTWVVRR